jgi:hypothetical protein
MLAQVGIRLLQLSPVSRTYKIDIWFASLNVAASPNIYVMVATDEYDSTMLIV